MIDKINAKSELTQFFTKDLLENGVGVIIDEAMPEDSIEDFIKIRYADIFLDEKYQIDRFRLFFITDAYRLKRRGLTEKQIRSFLLETKIMTFNAMPLFHFRNFKVMIEYQLPNPLLGWY